jgi:hypothetical protein
VAIDGIEGGASCGASPELGQYREPRAHDHVLAGPLVERLECESRSLSLESARVAEVMRAYGRTGPTVGRDEDVSAGEVVALVP